MKFKFLISSLRQSLIGALLLIGFAGFSQLSVSQQNAQTLVQNVLLGSGVTVSNITFTGDAAMLGSFNGTNSNIGLNSGIIMSTGRISDAVGPNNVHDKGEDMQRNGYQPLANLLDAGAETYDAAVLSFRFICEGDQVQFRYVFASEEYPEYVGTEFNDVFAFFIQGPGITGNQNIALIPGTTQPVAINNVNGGSYSSFFINNGNGNQNNSTVQFDGFTTPFIAEANVVPCQEYIITIAITDVSDGIYDSGVFLEAQSFLSPDIEMTSKISYVDGASELYESCGYNTITLTRTGVTNTVQTIFLETSGAATYGVDYTDFPTAITFQPGQNVVSFNVLAFQDGTNEPGGESVTITYRDTGCSSIDIKQVDFIIFDPPPPVLVTPGAAEQRLCPREPVDLNVDISGGVSPYLITWEGQAPGNPVTVYPDSSDWYTVTVTDQCGATIVDSMFTEIKDYIPLKLSVSTDTILCKGQKVIIGGNSTGGKLPIVYSWDTPGIFTSTREVQPETSTEFKLSVTDSCGITITKTIFVQVIEVHAVFDVAYIDHSTVKFNDLSYTDIANWEWDFGDGTGSSLEQNPVHTYPDTGNYIVTLIASNEKSCKDTISNVIVSYPPFNFWIPNAFTPDGDGLNDAFSGVGEGFITYELRIYNRWGEEIFDSKDYDSKWGTGSRGVLDKIPVDVYAYRIILGTPTLEKKEFIGRVSVIR